MLSIRLCCCVCVCVCLCAYTCLGPWRKAYSHCLSISPILYLQLYICLCFLPPSQVMYLFMLSLALALSVALSLALALSLSLSLSRALFNDVSADGFNLKLYTCLISLVLGFLDVFWASGRVVKGWVTISGMPKCACGLFRTQGLGSLGAFTLFIA